MKANLKLWLSKLWHYIRLLFLSRKYLLLLCCSSYLSTTYSLVLFENPLYSIWHSCSLHFTGACNMNKDFRPTLLYTLYALLSGLNSCRWGVLKRRAISGSVIFALIGQVNRVIHRLMDKVTGFTEKLEIIYYLEIANRKVHLKLQSCHQIYSTGHHNALHCDKCIYTTNQSMQYYELEYRVLWHTSQLIT